ncbi:MAG: hypothetical protein BHV94_00690 [Clostridiales bacterium 59_14]|nr:MAG: hypothetical protein BHV94_00690 [Clostridiales bacterium 59_14]
MNLGRETETLEFKKSTGELKEGIISIGAILNKHQKGASTAMRSISTSCFVRRLTSASPPCGWKRNGSPA